MTAPEYPRKDDYHHTTYWTGPLSDPNTHVTGFRRWGGASVDYYQVTCTCTPYRGVGPTRNSRDSDIYATLAADSYAHALTHLA